MYYNYIGETPAAATAHLVTRSAESDILFPVVKCCRKWSFSSGFSLSSFVRIPCHISHNFCDVESSMQWSDSLLEFCVVLAGCSVLKSHDPEKTTSLNLCKFDLGNLFDKVVHCGLSSSFRILTKTVNMFKLSRSTSVVVFSTASFAFINRVHLSLSELPFIS